MRVTFATHRRRGVVPFHGRRAIGATARYRRCGVALPLAIITLALIALFVAGSAFLALHEARAATGRIAERRALEAAEYGLSSLLRDWDDRWNTRIGVGDTVGTWTHILTGGAVALVRAIRLTPTTFHVWSEGTAGAPIAARRARRTLAGVLRLDAPDAPVSAALTVRDSAWVGGGGLVSGSDTVTMVGGVCAATPAPVAGVAAPDTSHVCVGTCGGIVTGSPPLTVDTSASDPRRYGTATGEAWAALAARADIVLPPDATVTPAPVAVAGVCQRGPPGNWGDPAMGAACADWLPVILAQGDVTMAGGVGQGILIAAGDVRLEAGARFTGVIVAGDDVVTDGSATVLGAVLAGDARSGAADHTRIATGTLRFSGCAVTRALLQTSAVARLGQRWWTELF